MPLNIAHLNSLFILFAPHLHHLSYTLLKPYARYSDLQKAVRQKTAKQCCHFSTDGTDQIKVPQLQIKYQPFTPIFLIIIEFQNI